MPQVPYLMPTRWWATGFGRPCSRQFFPVPREDVAGSEGAGASSARASAGLTAKSTTAAAATRGNWRNLFKARHPVEERVTAFGDVPDTPTVSGVGVRLALEFGAVTDFDAGGVGGTC